MKQKLALRRVGFFGECAKRGGGRVSQHKNTFFFQGKHMLNREEGLMSRRIATAVNRSSWSCSLVISMLS